MLTISDEGLALIKTAEGFRPQMYNCPAGHATIGYGHLIHYGPIGVGAPARGITQLKAMALEAPFQRGLTETQASDLLRTDLVRYEEDVRRLVTVPLDQGEFDALTSFHYNTGALAASTLLKVLNASDYDHAAAEFDRWVNVSGHPLAGLVVRRNAEEALFRRDLPRVAINL